MKAVMYGAGNIGRGFIGAVFAESGYSVTFIDVAEETVKALQREGRYPVRILDGDKSEDHWIEGVSAVDGRDLEAASACIAETDLMATAVGVRVLPFIAPVIAEGLKKRFAKTDAPLSIIICENLIDANKLLAKLIKEKLSPQEIQLFEKRIGLVEASIGRMVPIQTDLMRDGNPLRVCVEAYGFLPLDKAAFSGAIPNLKGMVLSDNFDFYIQRKLFVHNMGHAICAYLGMLLGDTYIAESAGRAEALFIAENAMLESARALSKKFGMPLDQLTAHIGDLLRRFTNKALGDTCERVGADTERKLGPQDRLIGALHCCIEQGIIPAFITAGTAAALYRHLGLKKTAQNRENAASVLETVSGLDKASPEAERILAMYDIIVRIGSGAKAQELISAAMHAAYQSGVV
jgi:mannitol-1-phosphate 5-dehydrogenase